MTRLPKSLTHKISMMERTRQRRLAIGVILAVAAVAVAIATPWLGDASVLVNRFAAAFDRGRSGPSITDETAHDHADHDHSHDDHSDHDHDAHNHDHADHDHADSPFARRRERKQRERVVLEMTPQAIKNLGLTAAYLKPVQLADYYRTITIPAMVVPKSGRTEIQVSSPMEGIVQHVHAVSGEAVEPGELLFEVRLTYEDLVDTQVQLLKNLADLEIEQREVQRLEEVTRSGAVASKVLLERQYALQKLQSSVAAQRAALKLHGLNDEQIETIIRERHLLRDLSIVAPTVDRHEHQDDELRLSSRAVVPASFLSDASSQTTSLTSPPPKTPLVVDRLSVNKGQGVKAGETLCVLSDYSSLYVEGRAFEQDAPFISAAANQSWPIEASVTTLEGSETLGALQLAFVANEVDPQSRTLAFYLDLHNEVLRDDTNAQGQRFVTWKYRIGQRMELRVPVEAWKQQIVLPIEAAVKEGLDWFVFRKAGHEFERVTVHVKHRDPRFVVIENDGAIKANDVIAHRSAHQMQLAIKNQQGGGVDPHAGHSH